jgi:GNAT superfamily N-acetyltransferase
MNIEFALAAEQDIPEILTMMEEFYAIDHYPFSKNQTAENMLFFISNPELGRLWMIVSEGSILGYIIFTFGYSFEHGGRFGLLDEFFLKSDFRGKGLGKLVMDFINDEARKLGIGVLLLEVEKHNAAGLKLYREKGYQENGRLLLTKKVTRN